MIFSKHYYGSRLRVASIFLLPIIPFPIDYSPIIFEKENYLTVKYKLVKEVYISQVFFLTLLVILQENINYNHDAS